MITPSGGELQGIPIARRVICESREATLLSLNGSSGDGWGAEGSEVARVKLAEPGMIGVTKPRIPRCFMRATKPSWCGRMAQHGQPGDRADDRLREVSKAPRGSVVFELAAEPEDYPDRAEAMARAYGSGAYRWMSRYRFVCNPLTPALSPEAERALM